MDLAAAAAGSFPEADNGQPVPWEDPGLSRLVGFGRTLGKLLFHPEDFCAHLGPGGRAEPFAFGLIAGTAGLLGCFFWYLLLAAAASRDVVAVSGDTQAFTMGAALVIMALAPILILIELLIGSLCLWAGAALLGLGAGFTPAWRIYCYVQGGGGAGPDPYLRGAAGGHLDAAADLPRRGDGLAELGAPNSGGPGGLPGAPGLNLDGPGGELVGPDGFREFFALPGRRLRLRRRLPVSSS